MAKSSAILGACGEHYVAAFLSRFQLIVALPRAGVPGCDLLVANENTSPAIRMQVKTGRKSTKNTKSDGQIYLWATSYKVIEKNDEHLWYAYVWINNWPEGDSQPELSFVPAKVVVETMMQCQIDGDTFPHFWMKVADAQQYKGKNGLLPILDKLGLTTTNT